MSGRRRAIAACGGVFLVALTVRLAVFAATPARQSPDSQEYLTFAKNIRLHGSFSLDAEPPFTPSIRRAPLYSAYLAAIWGPGDEVSLNRVRVSQCILDALIAAGICLLVWNSVRSRWALVAGMIYAFHPGAVVYSNTILSETLFAFLFTSTIAALVLAIRRDGAGWSVTAGVLLGLTTLCRPVAVPFIAIAVGAFFFERRTVVRPIRLASLFIIASLVTIAPWIIRSSLMAERFVLVTFRGSVNFYLATISHASWDLNDQASIFQGAYWQTDPCGLALGYARTPAEAIRSDDLCTRLALANVRANPGYYIRNRLRQVVHFPLTSFDFVTGNRITFGTAVRQRSYDVLATKIGLWSAFSFVPLLCGLLGLLFGPATLTRRLCAAGWLFTILIYLPGFVEYRYFLPAVAVLLATSAYGFEWVEDRLRRLARHFGWSEGCRK